jgi:FkbM family methyltransferase
MRQTRLVQLRTARELANGLTRGPWKIHAFLVLAALQMIPRHLPRRLAWMRIALPSGEGRQFWLEDFTQARALAEVFTEHDYDVAVDGPVRTVVDLGANAGQASVYLRDRFPDADILAVEADPAVAVLAARNTAEDPRTAVISAAVTGHDGTVTLTRLPGHTWGSNVFDEWSQPDSPRLEVRSISLESLLSEHGFEHVDVLKVDVEGAEVMALTADRTLERVDTVIGELHPSILKMGTDEALDVLKRHGSFDRAWMHREFIFVLARTANLDQTAGSHAAGGGPASDAA